MKHDGSCETRIVAQSHYCSISQCEGCDTYHLHIGPVSLRIKPAAFSNLCEVLAEIHQRHTGSSGAGRHNVLPH